MKFISTFVIAIILLIFYGISENKRKNNLYTMFFSNQKILCNDLIIQKSRGWYIKDNTYFTNDKVFRTIIYCKKYTEDIF